MKIGPMKPNLLSIAIATVLGCSTFSVYAEEAEDKEESDEQVLVVTGIRGSVMRSMDMKRDAQGVVDAISMEDIGKFPDTNLAESLQRITGVSIDRKNNEGNQVSVRGFGPSFNMVTLNGRQMPAAATQRQENDSSAEQSRAFNFAEIAAESVAGVEVYKTSKAHVTTGGIGATINILTAKPLSLDDSYAFASVKAISDGSTETGSSITPEVSGIYSVKTADETVGFLVNASYSERNFRENFVATDGWLRVGPANVDVSAVDSSINPTGQIWMPRNLVVDQSDHERERTNAMMVFQWAPSDKFNMTIDYVMSDYEDKIERSQAGVWFESPNPIGVADANGSVTRLTVPNNAGAGLGALDWQGYSDIISTENRSIGFNFGWQATENVNLEFDYHDSYSDAQPSGEVSDFLVIISAPLGSQITADFNTGIPSVSIDDSGTAAVYGGAVSGYLDPAGIRPNIDLARNKSVRNDVEQFQINGTWVNSKSGALQAINFGGSLTDYRIQTGWLFDLGVQGQPTCGINGGQDATGNVTCADLTSFMTVENSHFPSVFPQMLTFNARDVFTSVTGNMGTVFDLLFTNDNIIEEETTALYTSFEFETEFNNMPVDVVAGIRYEKTDVTGTTIQTAPEAMVYVSPTEFRPQLTAVPVAYSLENDYEVFLPSLDTAIEIQDDMIVRFSYGRTLARSDLNSMKPALSITDARPGGPYNAAQGNPGLLPYISDNIDFAYEYYYDSGSYFALNYFKKWVENYVVSTITQDTIMGALGYELTDPNPQDLNPFPITVGGPDDQVIVWDILSVDNGEAAQVDGFEIALQHLFGDTGFGMQANITFVDGDVEYDVTQLDQDISLTGLSDSANLVGFYEKDGIQIRLAYNWRDEFLLARNQLRQVNEPVFVDTYGQWDLSASYELNDSYSIFLEGINITGEEATAHGRFDNQFMYHADQEARYAFGIRGKF